MRTLYIKKNWLNVVKDSHNIDSNVVENRPRNARPQSDYTPPHNENVLTRRSLF